MSGPGPGRPLLSGQLPLPRPRPDFSQMQMKMRRPRWPNSLRCSSLPGLWLACTQHAGSMMRTGTKRCSVCEQSRGQAGPKQKMEILGQNAMLSGLCRYCQPLSHQVGGHHHASYHMTNSGSRRSLAMQVWKPALVLHGMLRLQHQCHAVCRAMCRSLSQPCSPVCCEHWGGCGQPCSIRLHGLPMFCVDCCATAESSPL